MRKDKKFPAGLVEKKLEEIKKGEVFDVPEDYFQNLEQRIFAERRSEFILPPESPQKRDTIRFLKPLAYAASLLILVGMVWWMWKGADENGTGLVDKFIPEYVLEQYLESEIMELDLDYLLQDLTDEDLQVLSEGIMLPYESYIDAYFEDFEEFMY